MVRETSRESHIEIVEHQKGPHLGKLADSDHPLDSGTISFSDPFGVPLVVDGFKGLGVYHESC
jgi:hypothetical protein